MAEVALLVGSVLGAVVIVGAIIGVVRARGPYAQDDLAALGRSQRAVFVRTTYSVLVTLVVFSAAVIAHIVFPLWQGVSFLVGPTLGTAAGLTVFALFPAVPIEGEVDRHVASLERRNSRTLASPTLRWTFVGSTVLAIAVAVACGLVSRAAPDGRFVCTALFNVPCTVGGPYLFPGWYFGVPAIIAVVLLAASTVLAFRRVMVSPGAAWPELVEADRVLRENVARLILCIGIAPLMLTAGMLLAAAGLPLFNAPVLVTGLSAGTAHELLILGLALMLAGATAMLVGLAFTIAAARRGINVGRLSRRRREGDARAVGQTA
jgi:hypothetical protein